jgi:hypothetical protein
MTVFSSALVLASVVGLGTGLQAVAQAPGQSQASANALPVTVTQVMVTLTVKPGIARADVMKVLPEEVRETVKVYLDGKIDQWYARGDGKGVVFFLRCTTVEEAKAIMGGLPLDRAGYVDLEYVPVGPLAPLRLLTRPPVAPAAGDSH